MNAIRSHCVVIPVYNESIKIRRVLERLRDAGEDNVIVVDDGSTDDSVVVCREFDLEVIELGTTLGVGRALVRGFERTLERGFDYCVFMAGNDKDEPLEIPRLLEPLDHDKADFVQGSRWLKGGGTGGDMPFYRKLATRFHPMLFSLAVGKRLTESTNGFRALRCSLLEETRIDLSQSWLDGYEMEPYLLYRIIKCGYRHVEVPCTKVYPPKKQGITKMRPIIDWWHIIKPIFILRLGLRK